MTSSSTPPSAPPRCTTRFGSNRARRRRWWRACRWGWRRWREKAEEKFGHLFWLRKEEGKKGKKPSVELSFPVGIRCVMLQSSPDMKWALFCSHVHYVLDLQFFFAVYCYTDYLHVQIVVHFQMVTIIAWASYGSLQYESLYELLILSWTLDWTLKRRLSSVCS